MTRTSATIRETVARTLGRAIVEAERGIIGGVLVAESVFVVNLVILVSHSQALALASQPELHHATLYQVTSLSEGDPC